jgi:hypothetical protein
MLAPAKKVRPIKHSASFVLSTFYFLFSCRVNVKERRHCERSDAIHDFQRHGSPRYARDDGTSSSSGASLGIHASWSKKQTCRQVNDAKNPSASGKSECRELTQTVLGMLMRALNKSCAAYRLKLRRQTSSH